MHRVAMSCEARASHLIRAAQFNIGRAYYQGSGVRRSVVEAERLIETFVYYLSSTRQFSMHIQLYCSVLHDFESPPHTVC